MWRKRTRLLYPPRSQEEKDVYGRSLFPGTRSFSFAMRWLMGKTGERLMGCERSISGDSSLSSFPSRRMINCSSLSLHFILRRSYSRLISERKGGGTFPVPKWVGKHCARYLRGKAISRFRSLCRKAEQKCEKKQKGQNN